jgi:F-type H+-transporting ATPase subunit b
MFWAIVNFLIFIGIVIYFLFRPTREFLAHRRSSIRSAIQEAQRSQQRAEAKFQEYERKLREVTREVDEIIAHLSQEGELEKKRIITNAEKLTERMREEIQHAANRELENARTALKEEAARLALSMAEQVVKNNISHDDQTRLIKEYIEKIGALQ